MEKSEQEIIAALDPTQRQAVLCTDGPVLIVAGAGSGKTRVLTSRIAYLLAKGADPSRILALTFTRKAAGEMKERIGQMVGAYKARFVVMGTFHSVFVRFLREYADVLGYPKEFTIYDTSDQTSAIKHCIKELNLDDKVYKPKEVLGRISMAKNNLYTAEAYAANTAAITNDRNARKGEIHRIYTKYQQLLKSSGVMDFDDILVNMNILLDRKDAEGVPILPQIAQRFDYILVDEYQDTNYAQYLIVKKLSQQHRNICVVGDDSQSIYAFRGAKIENILNFRKDYPESKFFALERNYRSTRVIVDAANSVIAKNVGRIPKKCFSDGLDGEKITLLKAYDEREEASMIVSSIVRRIHSESAVYQDFAILYRTNSQSRALEEALRKRNIPYMIFSGNSFYERAEVKDLMAYLKLIVNPRDDESFRRAIAKPARGIGDTSLSVLATAASAENKPLCEAAVTSDLEKYGLKKAAIERIAGFVNMILAHNAQMGQKDAYQLTLSIAEASGLYRFFKEDKSIEGQSRAANVEELINSAKAFVEEQHNTYIEDKMVAGEINDADEISEENLPLVTLGDYLENISLLSAVDVSDEESSNKVALMTVHSAKGLEFPYGYIAGCEENLFPGGGMLASPAEIEEERRLFYVALTRAQKVVDLSFATTRMRNGKHESNAPSRFVKEINPSFISNPLGRDDDGDVDDGPFVRFDRKPSFGGGRPSFGGPKPSFGASRPQQVQPAKPAFRPAPAPAAAADFQPDPIHSFQAGMQVEHNRFGFGQILEISGDPSDLKAKIRFQSYGEKLLLLKYAKMRIVKK
ncbi:MAG: UvrD-helicase domain-containing protein [Bacteroidales bacterium]|nr:UvrD-helicase domain-containing protein [Bacteroidales bacterium]